MSSERQDGKDRSTARPGLRGAGSRDEPRELISGRVAAGPLAHVQALLAVGAATNGALAALLPHPAYFNVMGLLAVQVCALGYGAFVMAFRNQLSMRVLKLGNLLAAVLTSVAVYFSGDSTSAYVIFYLWIGFYVFYYPVSKTEVAFNLAFGAACYAVAIGITPDRPPSGENVDVAYFSIVAGTLATAGLLLTYLRQRVDQLMARLVDASRTDPLTELPNRTGLQQALAREHERSEGKRPVSLILIDLDRFKDFNDRWGFATGDQLLREVAIMLNRSCRLIDTVARSGGAEFAIVMPETDQHDSFLLAEQILSRLRANTAETGRAITASAGVATVPDHAADVAELLANADRALTAAKALGRDRAVIFSPEVTGTVGAMMGRRSVESQAQLATVLSLAEALDQRDSGTARHSVTVGLLCEAMARELGLAQERVQRIKLAGILHDIGKIGVPDAILRKPGPLTDEERDQMRRHPELGARILSSDELADVREWILAHHEQPDGQGYPKGLSGDEIPIEAAILAVGDAYEAMTSDRVYRMSIGPVAAREELRRRSGTQFVPAVVDALLSSLERESAGLTS